MTVVLIYPSTLQVLVMSDSAAVVEAAQKQSFHDRIVNVDGPVMHVDRTGQAVSTR